MFTGIVEETAKVNKIVNNKGSLRIQIRTPKTFKRLKISDSISINGVCHTIVKLTNNCFEVDSVEETLKKTSLKFLKVNSEVNLERPLRLNSLLGGHLVLGHVDTVGIISSIEKRENSWMYTIDIPKKYMQYIIPVGSIAVDGVSLTVAEIIDTGIIVSIIPKTMEKTIFKNYVIGTVVNLEFDVLGKYIERLLLGYRNQINKSKNLTVEELRKQGF